jgi:GDP-mannose 6-dehydrogenase
MNQGRIAVLGLGYVGCVTATCLAKLGHRVIGVDRDPFKVEAVRQARAPFYEPGLTEIIEQTVAAGRLSATTDLEEALAVSDVALICVGTPSARNGNLSTEQLERVSREISGHLDRRTRPLTVAVRSTVFPGTCDEVVAHHLGHPDKVRVVANPEFLREGVAVRDFMEATLVVVGGHDEEAVRRVAALYEPLGTVPCLVALRTAELIKYACNAFHAVKIAFANEIGALGEKIGVDGGEVMETLCRDTALNISTAYLKPGFAFGGSCLPKDLRALSYRANRLDLKLPLLESTLPSNDQHLNRAIQAVVDHPGERIGVFGLAFKENTDDLRESPVVGLLEHLIGKGREVRVFDPHIQLDQIYGSNQQFVLGAIPHIGRLLSPLEDVLEWCDFVVIAQKPSQELLSRIATGGKPLLDLVGVPPRAAQSA